MGTIGKKFGVFTASCLGLFVLCNCSGSGLSGESRSAKLGLIQASNPNPISNSNAIQSPTPTPRSTPLPSPSLSPVPSPSPLSGSVIRINVDGPSFFDSAGNFWGADPGIQGNGYGVPNTIQGTSEQVLYQSQKWNPGGQDMAFAVSNGKYKVTLKFAELYFSSAGMRIFDIYINGQLQESGLDVFAQIGQYAALDRSFNVEVTTGQIDIFLQAVVEDPNINGIEIIPTTF